MNKKILLSTLKKIWNTKEDDELSNIVLEKIFKSDTEDKPISPKDYVGYKDGRGIIFIVPKKEYLKKFIEDYFEIGHSKEDDIKNLVENFNTPNFYADFTIKEDDEISYNSSYHLIMSNLMKGSKSIKIKINKCKLLYIEGENFICVLAPRITENEKGGKK